MLLEVEIPAKTFVTDATSERLLFVVGVHVKGQVVDLQCEIRFRSRPFGFSPAYSTQSYVENCSSANISISRNTAQLPFQDS